MKENHTKKHIIYDSIYIKLKTRQNSPMEMIEVSLVVTFVGWKKA